MISAMENSHCDTSFCASIRRFLHAYMLSYDANDRYGVHLLPALLAPSIEMSILCSMMLSVSSSRTKG